MIANTVNADFAIRVAIDTELLPWIPSPQPGVERRLLDRIGGEVARATTIVRYASNSKFNSHDHTLGEEFLVLDGVFSDEHGDYPKGTYVRNPPGSRHSPFTDVGCVILVKLRQMPLNECRRVVINTLQTAWHEGADQNLQFISLFSDPSGETVAIEKLAPHSNLLPADIPGGEELFILDGNLSGIDGTHTVGTWIRHPAGSKRMLHTSDGAIYWVKRGHLPVKP